MSCNFIYNRPSEQEFILVTIKCYMVLIEKIMCNRFDYRSGGIAYTAYRMIMIMIVRGKMKGNTEKRVVPCGVRENTKLYHSGKQVRRV